MGSEYSLTAAVNYEFRQVDTHARHAAVRLTRLTAATYETLTSLPQWPVEKKYKESVAEAA